MDQMYDAKRSGCVCVHSVCVCVCETLFTVEDVPLYLITYCKKGSQRNLLIKRYI